MSQGPSSDARDLPQRIHQRLIGCFGLLLPPMLWLVSGWRPTPPLPQWELLGSLSVYYYTGATTVLVGLLFALGLFLLSYPGYEGFAADRVLGRIAGVAALGVAFFPTGAPDGLTEPPWWSEPLKTMHFGSAVVLMASFAVFSLWLFRKSSVPKGAVRPPDKRRRDQFYLVCGLVIVAALLWALSSYFTHVSVFWPESIALWAFGASWLVKGEAIPLGPRKA